MKLGVTAVGYVVFLILIVSMANRGELSDYITFYRVIPYGDAVGHFLLMGTLSLILNLLLKARQWSWGKFRVLYGSSIVTVLVTAEEISQIWLPARTFSWIDLGADLLGIFCFGRIAWWYLHRRRRGQ